MKIPPALYSGHLTDPALLRVFYGAMHGEDIWMKHGVKAKDWADEYLFQFCTLQLPYFYLNRLERLKLTQDGDEYIATFSDGVVSNGRDGRITKHGAVLKSDGDVLLPLDEACTVFIAYSKDGRHGDWAIPDAAFSRAAVWEITPDGNVPAGETKIQNGIVQLNVRPGQALLLQVAEGKDERHLYFNKS